MENTKRMLKRDKTLTKFEKVLLISQRDEDIQNGAKPYFEVGEDLHDTNAVATQEYYLGLLDDYRVRRFYPFGPSNRLYKDFKVGDLREFESAVRPLMRTAYTTLHDLEGKQPELKYWNEHEIKACVGVVLDQTALPGGELPIDGNESLYIVDIRAPFEFLRAELKASLRLMIQDELRRVKLPNSVQDIFRVATYIGYSYNAALVTPNQLVGDMLNDVVVDSQGVISSFHAIGRRISALAMQMAAEQLIKGNFKQHADHLVFNKRMDPFLAIQYDRKFSDLRFNEILHEHTVQATSTVARSRVHRHYIQDTNVEDSFVRLHFKVKLLCWHEVLLSHVGTLLSKFLATEGVVVIPHTQQHGIIDVFLSSLPGITTAQTIHAFENQIIPKIRFSVKDNCVKGITSYTAQHMSTTGLVLLELPRSRNGDTCEFLWHVDAHELHISSPGDPLGAMLHSVDPDAVFEPYLSGGDTCRQYRVVVSEERMKETRTRIEILRVASLEVAVNINNLKPTRDDCDTVTARILGRQADIKLTPLTLMNSLGEEEVLREMQEFELTTRQILRRDPHEGKTRVSLFRALNPRVKNASNYNPHYRNTTLLSAGTNILDNLEKLPGVDSTRCYPINPSDTYNHLGCEAMRLQLLRILINSFSKKSKRADSTHLVTISQIMTSQGHLTKLSEIMDCEPVLKNATRSRAMLEFSNAALKGATDKLPGVLTSQVLGQPLMAGTGSSMVLPPLNT